LKTLYKVVAFGSCSVLVYKILDLKEDQPLYLTL